MNKVKSNPEWIVKETANDVAIFARDAICQAAQRSIKDSGEFKLVLAGGTTPQHIYALLAEEDCDWQHWHIYLGDERCLPVNDPERNSTMIQQTLLDKVNIPESNIHFINAELGAKVAAKAYDELIQSVFPFDMVLLGMGEDGHTASLFPGHSHSKDEYVHAVYNSPKPPSDRVSISSHSLSENKVLLVIVTGVSKRDSVTKWRNGDHFPVAQIGSKSKAVILLDSPAWQV